MCTVPTDSQYPAVEADGIPHGVRTHLEDELHPGLEGLWVGVSVLLHNVTLDGRSGGQEVERSGGRNEGKKIRNIYIFIYINENVAQTEPNLSYLRDPVQKTACITLHHISGNSNDASGLISQSK